MKFTGKAIIRVNGSELRSTDDATLSVGGENRKAIKGGGRVYGYNEETQEPTLECNVAHCGHRPCHAFGHCGRDDHL